MSLHASGSSFNMTQSYNTAGEEETRSERHVLVISSMRSTHPLTMSTLCRIALLMVCRILGYMTRPCTYIAVRI